MSGLCGGTDDPRAGGHLVLGSGGGVSSKAHSTVGDRVGKKRETTVADRFVPVFLRSPEFSFVRILLTDAIECDSRVHETIHLDFFQRPIGRHRVLVFTTGSGCEGVLAVSGSVST